MIPVFFFNFACVCVIVRSDDGKGWNHSTGRRKWKWDKEEKSQAHTHMQTLGSTHIQIREGNIVWVTLWHDQMWWRLLSHASHRILYTDILASNHRNRSVSTRLETAKKQNMHLFLHATLLAVRVYANDILPSSSISFSFCMNAMQIVTDLQCLINSVQRLGRSIHLPNDNIFKYTFSVAAALFQQILQSKSYLKFYECKIVR